MLEISTNKGAETQLWGEKLGKLLQANDIILLEGDLGVGKTTFTKGLARGLGIQQIVKSPTFTYIKEYREGRLPLFHMDFYRLEASGEDELEEDLELDEYIKEPGVIVSEWSKAIASSFPNDYLLITIKRQLDKPDYREITFIPRGKKYQQLVKKLSKLL